MGGEDLSYISSFRHLAKFTPSIAAFSCSRLVLCSWGSSRGTHRVLPYLHFQRRMDFFFGGVVERALGIHFRSVASGHSFTISHCAVTWRNCVILWGQCWGRFLCSSGGVPLSERGSAHFPLRNSIRGGHHYFRSATASYSLLPAAVTIYLSLLYFIQHF